MSVTLSRQSGSATYTNQELAALITSLEASNNQHTVASGVAFYRISALRMLILDVDALHNRKLVETYAITHDSTNPFELKFTSSNIDMNLDQALNGVGFSNLTPVASLAAINAALYVASATDQYLATSTLVKSQGSFAVAPAELKTLAVGNNMTLTEGADTVTLDATGFAPASLTKQSVLDAIHVGPNLLVDRTTPDQVNISGIVNQQDLFQDILVGPGLTVNRDTTNQTITIDNTFTQTVADGRYAPISGGSVDLSNYRTAPQIQTVVNTLQSQINALVGTVTTLHFPNTPLGHVTMVDPRTFGGVTYHQLGDANGAIAYRHFTELRTLVGGTLNDNSRTFTGNGFICTLLSCSELIDLFDDPSETEITSAYVGPWRWTSTPNADGSAYCRVTRDTAGTYATSYVNFLQNYPTIWRVSLQTITA